MARKIPTIEPSKAKRPRSAFDLSQRHLFTAHAGMLLPVLSLDLIPNDYVKIRATDFMRALPMQVAPFVSLRGVYEFYFVPYYQVWRAFDQFITGMTDMDSLTYKHYKGKAPVQVPRFDLEHLQRRTTRGLRGSGPDDSTPFVPLSDALGFSGYSGSARLLDLLGYGRRFDTNSKEYVSTSDNFYQAVNAFRPACYQKIYYDYYRNADYESADPSAYSLDGLDNIDGLSAAKLFTLRWRNSTKDMFTNVKPSILALGSISGVNNRANDANNVADDLQNFFHVSSDGSTGKVFLNRFKSADNGSFTGVSVGNTYDTFSISTLRAAYAIDKMARLTSRSAKTFRDQIKAHYGVDVPPSRDGKCIYIGGFDSDIEVSDVNSTERASLGVVGGKAIGSGSGQVEFTAKEHGVLMCIYSLVPRFSYDCTRIDPMVDKIDRFDFFTPEFENLGMQPLYARYISNIRFSKPHEALGFQPRYSEYKTALDVNHGQFSQNSPLSAWTLSKTRSFDKQGGFKVSHVKIDPRSLNSIFAKNYDGTENSDCVFGGCDFNIVKCSDMSESGEPKV